MTGIPRFDSALIGGSSTFALDFPEIGLESVQRVEKGIIFETPFGPSPPFTVFDVAGKQVITCKMHGWRRGVSRASASKQVFWVFKEAGVRKIVAEGGVGCISEGLKPRDLVIPHDYIDFSLRRDVSLSDDHLLIMRDPLCPAIRSLLLETALESGASSVSDGGVYAVTDGRHFESRAEVAMLEKWGAHVIGQSLCPEVYLAREIGACYAGIYQVVNYAEGIHGDWDYGELKDIFFQEAMRMGEILLKVLNRLSASVTACFCQSLRKPTLLKEP